MKKRRPITDREIRAAVLEAQFIALVIEHPQTPAHILETVKYMVLGACEGIAKYLKDHNPDAQMAHDIYPYGRAALGVPMKKCFKIFMEQVKSDAPNVLLSIMESLPKSEAKNDEPSNQTK
jgi:hypothetical protein